jgi:hypothetical protein
MNPQFHVSDSIAEKILDAESGFLGRTFRPAEMQLVAAALLGGVEDAAQIPAAVAIAAKSNSVIANMARRYSVQIPTLVAKLDAARPATLLAIAYGMMRFRKMRPTEMLGPNALPSLATLRRLGLVKASGHAAWGLCVVQLSDYRTCEFVLRDDPRGLELDSASHGLDDIAAAIVGLATALIDGDVENDVAGFGLAYTMALLTGWRHFRVQDREDAASVVQISREIILKDLYDGSLNGLVLQGINAPEVSTPAGSGGLVS